MEYEKCEEVGGKKRVENMSDLIVRSEARSVTSHLHGRCSHLSVCALVFSSSLLLSFRGTALLIQTV